jgi:hypothetical protein
VLLEAAPIGVLELPPSGMPWWPGASHSIVVNRFRSPQNSAFPGICPVPEL